MSEQLCIVSTVRHIHLIERNRVIIHDIKMCSHILITRRRVYIVIAHILTG